MIINQEHCGFIERLVTSLPPNHQFITYPIILLRKANLYLHCIWLQLPRRLILHGCLEVGLPFWMIYAPFCYVFIYTTMLCQQTLKRLFSMSNCMKTAEVFTCILWPMQPKNSDGLFQIFDFTYVLFGTANSCYMPLLVFIYTSFNHLFLKTFNTISMWTTYHIQVQHCVSTYIEY